MLLVAFDVIDVDGGGNTCRVVEGAEAEVVDLGGMSSFLGVSSLKSRRAETSDWFTISNLPILRTPMEGLAETDGVAVFGTVIGTLYVIWEDVMGELP